MTAKTLNVVRLARTTAAGQEEELAFEPGVNVVLGLNNSGKTIWLTFLDVLLGDTGSPRDALGELADKYVSARVELRVGGEPLTLERRWTEPGGVGKIYADDVSIPAGAFSDFFLERLEMPRLHFPKGNPYDSRAWPALSWRMLLRQIYRHESSWQDLAHQQPESEQHAVLLQFMGAAEAVYSPAYGDMVKLQKDKSRLEARKEQFEEMVETVGRELVSVPEAAVGFTMTALADAISSARTSIEQILERRDLLLEESSRGNGSSQSSDRVSEWGKQLAELREQAGRLATQVRSGSQRLRELTAYKESIDDEQLKLQRAQRAGSAFAELTVTHCPACDQRIADQTVRTGSCYVCHQRLPRGGRDADDGYDRVAFELQRMRDEGSELLDLIEHLHQETDQARRRLRDVQQQSVRVEENLRQVQRQNAWVVPPEIAELDKEVGRHEERVAQLQRLIGTLELKAQLSAEIDSMARRIAALRGEMEAAKAQPNFETTSDLLADRMTDYLNGLDAGSQERWGRRTVEVDVGEGRSRFTVNGRRWSRALGATLRAYFFMAYHYGLLSLSRTAPFQYPGFVVLDTPANLSRDMGLTDQENYLLVPFIRLLSRPEFSGLQVIAAGRAFSGIEGAHIVELGNRWG